MAEQPPRARPWSPTLALICAFALLLAGVLTAAFTEHLSAERRDRSLSAQAQVLAATLAAALVFDDDQAAQESVNALRANPLVEAAAVYDAEGRAAASFARPGAPPPANRRHDMAAGGVSVSAPIRHEGLTIGSVYLRARAEPLVDRVSRHGGTALLVVMALLLMGVLGSTQAASNRANRELRQKAEDLAFQIAERERVEEALRQSQKMEAMGQLTGGVAHDFNNLLMVASGGLDMLARTEDPRRREKLMNGIRQAVDRGAGLTRQLLAFARRSPLAPEVIDLTARLESMRLLLDRSLREDVVIDLKLAPDLWPVEIDPSQLEVSLLNLAVNARDAMPSGGTITVAAENLAGLAEGDLQGDHVRLVVADEGVGMPPETVARVFEPFFTTKGVGKGTGLGLSQVYGFTRASGGQVRIESQVGVGSKISMYLPRSNKPLAAPPQPAPAEATDGRWAGSALIVEDDDDVGDVVCEMFQALGWRVRRAPTASSALDLLDSGPAFDLVFSDMVMPGELDGIGLARIVALRRPDLPVILTTGYSLAATSVAAEGLRLLVKPYGIEALAVELAALRPRV
ncbi:MAG: integral rane sensor hybrid histidine kinase [Caulobacter sp.]|nr:integral rane sensor hybrid histidine kinase [Caulobacter sp.]